MLPIFVFGVCILGLSSAELSGSATSPLAIAPITQNNPPGLSYQALFLDNSTNIRGYVTGTSTNNGTGVSFNINIYDLPIKDSSLSPFEYHIHQYPVPADGNCSAIGGVLDPLLRGDSPPCDPKQPEECQVGDLSGKHGDITTSPFQKTYIDLYISIGAGSEAFFGSRSVAIHAKDSSILTCANFQSVAGIQPESTAPNVTVAPLPMVTTHENSGTASKYIGVWVFLAEIMVLVVTETVAAMSG